MPYENKSNDGSNNLVNEDLSVEIADYNLFDNIDTKVLKNYFDKINNIKSPVLYNEFINTLTQLNVNDSTLVNNEIIYLFVNKLVQ